jgi:protein-S-isoprenylcysteine O-methyltransferase Ste14
MLTTSTLMLAAAWIGYCALHSLLASLRFKAWMTQRWPAQSRSYRLAYNLLALGLLIPLLLATEFAAEDWLWRWQGAWAWFAHGTSALVLVGFVWSSRAYDMKAFLGIAPASSATPAQFGLSPLHRFVRHPWYFLGLLWLWTRDMDSARLVAALIVTGYLWLGSALEERKLMEELGQAYKDYCARVPGLLPRPWRYLSRAEFARLNAQGSPSNASIT